MLDYKKVFKVFHSPYYRGWFKNLWERNNATLYDFYTLANRIYKKVSGSDFPFEIFAKRWQWAVVHGENFKESSREFLNVILGWL